MISISEWTGKHQFFGQNTQQTRLLLIFFYKNEGTIFILFYTWWESKWLWYFQATNMWILYHIMSNMSETWIMQLSERYKDGVSDK